MKVEFLTPVGRLVQGDPFEAQTKDQQGAPLVVKTGPNAGQPTQRYFIAVAFRKDDPGFATLYQQMVQVARSAFPTLFDAAGNCLSRDFSWKLADGDSMEVSKPGEIPNAKKAGFAGHWVIKFSSSFAPRCFHAGHYAPHEQIQDPKAIPRGYYVRVAGSIEGNNNPQRPGIYVNLGMVELAGVGEIISTGPDASKVFGGAAAPLPAGAAPLPMHAGSVPGAVPSLPGMPAPAPVAAVPSPMPAAPAMPAPVGSPAAMQLPAAPMAVPPNPAFLAGPGGVPAVPGMPTPAVMPAPAPMAPPAPAAPVYQMTAAAGGFTRDQYVAQGWTDEQLRAQGMML